MKISLKWLSELFPESPAGQDPLSKAAELRVQLPLAGLEVGSVKRQGEGLDGVIVGHLLEFQKHPNADKLNVCKVATGKPGEVLQIVCGAPNVKAGAKVALAPVGCVLPGDFKIKQAAIRGVDSSGMLCSERELGLSEESNGIMLLAESAPVGSSLVKALGLSDEIWDVELTPDRADCLSHWGLAREVGRLLHQTPKLPEAEVVEASETGDVPLLSVEVQATKACPLYGAQLFEGLSGRPSPEWVRRLLEKLGIRSHNAVVDITNLVLMELGHPLHAFDADKIAGSKIIVRFAKANEKLKTLDGEERTLSPEDLVIADAEKPLALAGVMGGLDSGVTESTKRIVLESAVFDMDVIRAMARRHKIHSEASHRFERGVDPAGALRAVGRVSLLIRQLCEGRRRGAYLEIRSDKSGKLLSKHSLNFNLRTYKDVIGVDAGAEDIIKAFRSVGIDAQVKSANVLRVDVPTHRLDLSREIDLVEEAARLVGYDKIPEGYPDQFERTRARTGSVYESVRRVRHRLVETGLTEMMPYSFVSAERMKHIPGVAPVEILNPLSAEWQFMRPNLFFGLLSVVARQAGMGRGQGGFFDAGAVFESLSGVPAERSSGTREAWHAGWVLMGPRNEEHWSSDKKSADRKAHVDFFDGKGVAEQVVEGLAGIDPRWAGLQFLALDECLANEATRSAIAAQAPWIPLDLLHPGRSAILSLPGKPPGTVVGYVGELHPSSKRDILNLPAGLALGVVVGELRVMADLLQSLDQAAAGQAVRVGPEGKIKPSRKFPVVERDLAVVLAPTVKAGEVDRTFRKAVGPELLDLNCIDRFVLPDGRISLAWRFFLQAGDRTLTDAEITAFTDKALAAVKEKHGAELRG
ncbi:MAG: phenylalanine--tRNA ligase subunit beta [Bdellovibrionales bacterium]|nr:phenylalanine--tRNA ligase subunit beta [Bdellovibrionales bacterium]